MEIWVDADACPVVARDILCRAAQRTGVTVTFVANQPLPLPRSPLVQFLQVQSGFDVADDEIVRRAAADDLVITSDIPLAAEVMEKGAAALNPRGELYTPDTIKAVLGMRDFMDTMRASGVNTGGNPAYGQTERQAFANALDRWLARAQKAPSRR